MTSYLFAYGTLLPWHAPPALEHVLTRLQPVGPATMPGRLYDLGEYPGAVLDATAETRIRGHVLQLPAAGDLLQRIDRYEGFYPADPARSLFLRVKQTVTLASGSLAPASTGRKKPPEPPTQVM